MYETYDEEVQHVQQRLFLQRVVPGEKIRNAFVHLLQTPTDFR
jgi:hypothetical protein